MNSDDPIWRYIEEMKKQSAEERKEFREDLRDVQKEIKNLAEVVANNVKNDAEWRQQSNVALAEYGQLARESEKGRTELSKRQEKMEFKLDSVTRDLLAKVDEIDKAQQATLLMATKNNHTSKIVTYIGGAFVTALIAVSVSAFFTMNSYIANEKAKQQLQAKKP